MASPLSRLLRRPSALRHAASSSPSPSSFSSPASFAACPGPPKLPAAQQAEFERLQRAVAESPPAAAAAPDPVPDPVPHAAPPEFAGDVNPATGEVGGPKNEPLRWGAAGDWSYNGRVTDF